MWAARQGHTDMVKVLVENKADVNKAAASGGTALLVAVERGHLKMAEDLVEHGADVNAQNRCRKDPFDVGCPEWQQGDGEVVDRQSQGFSLSDFESRRHGPTIGGRFRS